MKLFELKELAEKGKLKIHKYGRGGFVRNQYIYSKEKDILKQKLITIKKISYTLYFYSARSEDMPKHKAYKITAKDYKELLLDGAVIET